MTIKLIHGDCLEVMPTLERESIDFCLTDPPYGITASLKWDSIIPFEPMWDCTKHVINKTAAICIFGIEPYSSKLRLSNIEMFKYDWIWHKKRHANFFQLNYQPRKTHEIISVFSYRKHNYYPIKVRGMRKKASTLLKKHRIGKYYKGSNKKFISYHHTYVNPEAIIKLRDNEKCHHNGYHPTQKPLNILEYLIKTYTKRGDTVLDFCMGSGSTGVACLNLGRNFIGIEKNSEYFKIAQDRLARHENNLRNDKKIIIEESKIEYEPSLFDLIKEG